MIVPSDPKNLPLRDIHLPDPVLWWPPAPGWWLLVLLCVTVVSLCLLLWRRHYQYRASAVRQAKIELQRIRHEFDLDRNVASLVAALSVLLRRLSISLYGRRQTAALVGRDWLQFLDQHGDGQTFSRGVGRILVTAPYRPESEQVNAEVLLQSVSDWIEAAHTQKREGIK